MNWSANGSFVPTEVEKARRGPTRIAREISRIYPAQHFGGVIFFAKRDRAGMGLIRRQEARLLAPADAEGLIKTRLRICFALA